MASISYFGQQGPYSQYEGSEIVAYAFSGYMYITGDPDREPLKAGGIPVGVPRGNIGGDGDSSGAELPGFVG